jgi:hypothetical protein
MSLEKGTLNPPFTSFLYKAKSQAEQIFSFCLAQFIALIKAVKAPDLRNSTFVIVAISIFLRDFQFTHYLISSSLERAEVISSSILQ